MSPAELAIALAVGLFTGVLSGLMGIGGGNIMVPASTILLGLTQHQAQGVSLVVIIPTAITGAYTHWQHGNIDRRTALLVAPGATVAGWLGAELAQRLQADTLRLCFGLLLLYFALRSLGVEAWITSRLRRR
jgi:uncharacterized membrane protein YfcA